MTNLISPEKPRVMVIIIVTVVMVIIIVTGPNLPHSDCQVWRIKQFSQVVPSWYPSRSSLCYYGYSTSSLQPASRCSVVFQNILKHFFQRATCPQSSRYSMSCYYTCTVLYTIRVVCLLLYFLWVACGGVLTMLSLSL